MRERKKKEQNEILDGDNYIRAFEIDQLTRRKIDDTGKMKNKAQKNNQDDDNSFELAANKRENKKRSERKERMNQSYVEVAAAVWYVLLSM